jgi:hypothetical protein
MPARATCLCVLALGTLLGCASSGYRNGVYRDEHVRYRAAAPAGAWQRMEVGDNDVAFHRAGWGTISVNSTCTDYDDVPTAALVNHLLFETSARQFVVDETLTLDGRGAQHVIVRAQLDGVPLELELFVMKKDGCVFDLSHVRSIDARGEARAAFAAFVAGFSVLSAQSARSGPRALPQEASLDE